MDTLSNSKEKISPSEISNKIRSAFKNIWRCADSNSWEELKTTNLLSFPWLDSTTNYLKKDFSGNRAGVRSIHPWVNKISKGDLIFIMSKNSFNGICIVETTYNFTGPIIKLAGSEKSAINVHYLFKLDKPLQHNFKTHNNPATFAEIDKYNFGLENIIKYLQSNELEAIESIMSYIEDFGQSEKKDKELIELGKNTIIYGPPGTGKTYQLNQFKESLFTDKGISKTADEVLKEKLKAYSQWKVIAAILAVSESPISVEEIVSHPLAKARFNFSLKTKPNNLVWGELLGFADDDSTELVDKYRRHIKLFTKKGNSKWTIAENKKEELDEIIGKELLEIAENPFVKPEVSLSSKTRYNFITFHQKYSYEDFIEGIKPLIRKDEELEQIGNLQFELKKGIFYNSCLEALKLAGYNSFEECHQDTYDNRKSKFGEISQKSAKQYALFIDEVNRANISAVLGELITLLEEDKRLGAKNEMWLELPYSNEKFCVPSNLYIICTMNTADRSIALLDIALRRRFEFKAMYPLYKEGEWWKELLEKINQAIYNWRKNPDFFIGHAFFIDKLESDKSQILNTKIIPLLNEYCQNNSETVKKILLETGIELKSTGLKENFQIIAE